VGDGIGVVVAFALGEGLGAGDGLGVDDGAPLGFTVGVALATGDAVGRGPGVGDVLEPPHAANAAHAHMMKKR
jgi:hypothetical protein